MPSAHGLRTPPMAALNNLFLCTEPYFRSFQDHAERSRSEQKQVGCRVSWICMWCRRAGIVDAYWEYRLKPWDVCAGVLIAREAGAVVTTMEGDPFSVFERSLLAAAPGLHEVRLCTVRSSVSMSAIPTCVSIDAACRSLVLLVRNSIRQLLHSCDHHSGSCMWRLCWRCRPCSRRPSRRRRSCGKAASTSHNGAGAPLNVAWHCLYSTEHTFGIRSYTGCFSCRFIPAGYTVHKD